jgi:hypothetical protein
MNGELSDIAETFRIFSNDQSDTVIESERNAPTFNSRISTQAIYKSRRISHFEIEWENRNEGAVQFANAHYQFTVDKILVTRDIDGMHFSEKLPTPEVFTILPLLRVYTGRAIRETFELGKGQSAPVLVPNIQEPNDNVQLLALELDMRSANQLEQEKLTINDTEYASTIFSFTGGNYDQTAKFWVDKNDILLKYEWQQNPDLFWEVKLVEIN